MAPIIEVSNETLETLNPKVYTIRNELESKSDSGFDYIPSIKLWVAREKTLFGKNFYESQKELHSKNQKMLNFNEFREYLKYQRENNRDIYEDITQVRSPWRAEWIDADFKMQGKDLYMNYHIFDSNGKIVQKSEKLDKNSLMKSKTPGISLASWLENATQQGLPQKSTNSGDLYYWAPDKDHNSVAWFNADDDRASLNCDGDPSVADSYLGVRAVRHE